MSCLSAALRLCTPVSVICCSYEEVSTAVLIMTLTSEVESEGVQSSELLECCTEALHSCVGDLLDSYEEVSTAVLVITLTCRSRE